MFLDEQASPNITGRLFKGSGSLAPLSSRIDACYLMQLYSEDVFNLLHTIRGIRNDFAHDPNPISFDDSRIKQRCKHVHGLTLKAADFGVAFVIGLCQSFGQGERLREWSWSAGDHTTATAREIFINAIKLCVVLTITATEAWANARPKARLPVRHVWPVPSLVRRLPAPVVAVKRRSSSLNHSVCDHVSVIWPVTLTHTTPSQCYVNRIVPNVF